jgi:hypothetical protein
MQPYEGPNANLDDDEFLALYEARSLRAFSHEDHVRMAFAYARRGGETAAVEGSRRIRDLAAALGAPGKYHETLTVAWARVIAWHARESSAPNFPAFLEEHPQLRRRDLLSAHYSRDVLFGPEARAAFVAPDVAPLPYARPPSVA